MTGICPLMRQRYPESLHWILLQLWRRQRRNRCLDETGQIIPVIHISYVEIVLRTVVGWSQDNFLQQSFARLCNLDVEVVVTDKAEENAVAISAPVPHHLFHGNLPGAGALPVLPLKNGSWNVFGQMTIRSFRNNSYICHIILWNMPCYSNI